MRLRVHRRHESGASNADNREERSHKLNASEIISRRQLNNSFHTTQNQIQQREQMNQTKYVNDQLYKVLMNSKPLYNESKKDVKMRKDISLPRTGQLEETQKGKRVFVGDSLVHLNNLNSKQDFKMSTTDKLNMLSSQVYGSNREDKEDDAYLSKVEIFQTGSPLSKATLFYFIQLKTKLKYVIYIEVKHESNKIAKLETQLVELRENKETTEGQFNTSKINEIKQAIQRKYHHRTNFKTIFQAWDEEGKGSITSKNVSSMLKRMGIKCNDEEAQILVSTADKDNSNSLNIQEFLDLVFVNNPQPVNDQSKNYRSFSTNDQRRTNGYSMIDSLPNLNNSNINDGYEISSPELQRKYRKQIQTSDVDRNEKKLNLVLKNKISQLLNNFWINDHKQTGLINQKALNDIIRRKVDLSSSVVSDQEIKQLFLKYQSSKPDQFDYKSFVKELSTFKYTEKEQNQLDIINESMKQTKQFENQMKKFQHQDPTQFNLKDVHINDIQNDNPSHIDWMKTRADKLSKHVQKFFNNQQEFSSYLKQQIAEDQNKDQIHKRELLKTFKGMFDKTDLKFEKRDYEGIMEMFQYNKHGYTNVDDIPNIVYQEDARQMYTRIGQKIRGPPPQTTIKNEGRNDMEINKANTTHSMYLNNNNYNNSNRKDNENKDEQSLMQELKKQSATVNGLQHTQSQQVTEQSRDRRGQSLNSCQSIQYDGYDTNTSYTRGQVKNVLKKVEDKLFLGDGRAYDVFKQFDIDNDGISVKLSSYVKKDELNQKLSQMSILNPQEQKIFNAYVDPANQGYLNFSQFNSKLYSNMSTQFEKNEYDMNPSTQKELVQNRINMSKTYNNFSKQMQSNPQRNRITSSSNYNTNNSEITIKPHCNTGMYASEQDRFSRNKLDFQQQDKQRKELYHFNKLQNMRTNQNIIEQRKQLSEMQIEQKTQSNLQQRAAVRLVYENVVKNNILTAAAM